MARVDTEQETQAIPGDDGPEPRVGPDDPAADAVRAALAEGGRWLSENTPKARAGEVKGVHRLRTTTRRLRTALELFRGLTDPNWADALAAECKWLAGTLGAVRDLDVLLARLSAAAHETDEALEPAIAPLFADLRARHAEASAALRQALSSDRFDRLEALTAMAATSGPLSEDAWRPCREVLPPLVGRAWKKLKNAARDLNPGDPPASFHHTRKLAKRARYAAEAVFGSLDHAPSEAAARFAKRARSVQDVLGEHQDAVVAGDAVRASALRHPDLAAFQFAAGRLFEHEARAASAAAAHFFDTWPALDRKKVVRWLKD